jgi:hypothetical protein
MLVPGGGHVDCGAAGGRLRGECLPKAPYLPEAHAEPTRFPAGLRQAHAR